MFGPARVLTLCSLKSKTVIQLVRPVSGPTAAHKKGSAGERVLQWRELTEECVELHVLRKKIKHTLDKETTNEPLCPTYVKENVRVGTGGLRNHVEETHVEHVDQKECNQIAPFGAAAIYVPAKAR
jgi:hypothetical protein